MNHEPEKNSGDKLKKNSGELKKNSGVQELKFFWGLKETLIYQDLDFQKLRCRLNGRLFAALETVMPEPGGPEGSLAPQYLAD